MPRAVLIANPSASQFTGGVYREVVSALRQGYELDTLWPVSGAETMRETRAAAEAHVDAVFAMGGDGVAHHVANGLAGTTTALGLLPVGTTNVLSRILGIPQKAGDAARAAIGYESVPTRCARIEAVLDTGPLTRVATFSVGVGFDAAVVQAAEQRPHAKVRFGGVYYATTAVGRLLADWRTRRANLRVTDGETPFDSVAVLTQVHDPYTYFGRVPLRIIDHEVDGLASLAVDELAITRGTSVLTRAVLGRSHDGKDGTQVWTAFDALDITADPASPLQADGELLGNAEHVTISDDPSGLRVLRPA